jgi:hypothetical protein
LSFGRHRVLDVWPARVLATAGTHRSWRSSASLSCPSAEGLGNALILAGVGVAALGSGLAGLGVGALAPALAVAALLLYAGFVVPTIPKRRRP